MRNPHEVSQGESLLTTSEIAQLFRVPTATVYAWRARGFGPPGFRVGRHTRYRRADVEAWIREQAHSEAEAAATP